MPDPLDVERTAKELRIDATLHTDLEEASTAETAARALDVPVGAVGKSIVVMVRGAEPVLVVVPGDRRVDMAKVAEEVGVEADDVRMANRQEVEEHTGFPAGGVPPVGLAKPIRTLLDTRLVAQDRVYVGAGDDSAMLEVSSSDLRKLPDVVKGAFSEPA